MAESTAQVLPSKPLSRAVVADFFDHLADQVVKIDKALVVISPRTITKPVLVAVSQATRDIGILLKAGVQNSIADLVAQLIRVPFGHRF